MKLFLIGALIGFVITILFVIVSPLFADVIDSYEYTIERLEEHKEWKRKRKRKATVEFEEGENE